MTVFIKYDPTCDWFYTNGSYYISTENIDRRRYKADSEEEAIRLFEAQFNVTVNNIKHI